MADLIDQVAHTVAWEDTEVPNVGAMKRLSYTPGPESINPAVEQMIRKELGSRLAAKAEREGIMARDEYMALMDTIGVGGELVVDVGMWERLKDVSISS
jgi:hypothetical protein